MTSSQRTDYLPEQPASPVPADASSLCDLAIRTYRVADHPDVLRLYRQGLLTGTLDPTDDAADLDRIGEAYLSRPEGHFWVAEAAGRVIATIGLFADDRGVAHIRRLRVDPAWRDRSGGEVARRVIRRAAEHAREFGQLKLVLHTPVQDAPAVAYLHQLGFEFCCAKEHLGRRRLEFYLNLYDRVQPPVGRPPTT